MARLVNIKKFTEYNKTRWCTGVILHDDDAGVSVATNGHWMILSRPHYNQLRICTDLMKNKNRLMAVEWCYPKKGKPDGLEETKYPCYESVIPTDIQPTIYKPSDFARAADAMERKMIEDGYTKKEVQKIGKFKVGERGTVINIETARMLALMPDNACVSIPSDSSRTPMFVYKDNDYTAVFMPMFCEGDEEDINSLI